ncbi:family 78 glycoside hydrolase catalytic domain [Demequina capsici]|uniref:Family 78 glycoside hydrolase catalytic domain n=1 Tax=Demequina capsici TaxID=3075620 RepID=A0AA96JB31_9MICO|nr:family 78 glycoside hydrolase catalytic domain [Demequina sp. OYTSA14]WNM25351.1 family 78 glycoside hydrolase catalytic domain [Demequina sp. OYTSA14]
MSTTDEGMAAAVVAVDASAWVGHWISHGPVSGPTDPIGIGREDGDADFGRYLFSTAFDLADVPAEALVRLTADSRYVLFCNGEEVGRGPVRSQPRRLSYDVLDLAPHLVEGVNSLVVLVTYYGSPNSFWFPAAANPIIGRRPVLVLEGQVGAVSLATDDSWRSAEMPAWTLATGIAHIGVPVEEVDARRLPVGWQRGEGVAWEPASILSASHPGALARSQPPTDPYGPLIRRRIGELGGDVAAPVGGAWSRVAARPEGENVIERATSVLETAAEPAGAGTEYLGTGGVLHGVLDMGRVVAGNVSFEVDAPAGTRVDLHYREVAWKPGKADPMSLPMTGTTYVARGEDDAYGTLEVNGFRYIHVVVDSSDDVEIAFRGLRVSERLYPYENEARFTSSDPELDALWKASLRTVQLNSQDAFTDCPTREQRAWVGDGTVHQMVHLAGSTDWRLCWQYLHLGNSPRSDGILPMSVAGETERGSGFTIPDWSLYWIRGLYEMHRHTDDLDQLAELLPTAERIVRWYLPFVTGDGVIADVPEWNLVDWSSIFLPGRSSILTSMWVASLGHVAEIADRVENGGTARWARGLIAAAREGFEQFWDADRGTYIDHIIDGEARDAASQLAGALAILSGLAPRERWDSIVAWITEPDRAVVRSWIGGDGGYSAEKIFDQLNGIQRIDWDAKQECVSAQPFASFLVHDALARAGRVDLIVRNIRRWSEFLRDGYDTFGECWGWGTPVHGWSSTPMRDLARYVVGVSPAAPGFAEARITPAYGIVDRFDGEVASPSGRITVSVNGRSVTVDSPVPFEVLDGAGTLHRRHAGRFSF